jgi:hypothetical protein
MAVVCKGRASGDDGESSGCRSGRMRENRSITDIPDLGTIRDFQTPRPFFLPGLPHLKNTSMSQLDDTPLSPAVFYPSNPCPAPGRFSYAVTPDHV